MRLTGRVVIVTGGGSGIGRATARAFAAEGASVLVVGRRPEPLAETAEGHPSITPFPTDVADLEAGAGVVAEAVERWGRLDVLVNNAAILRPTSLRGFDPVAARDTLATNLLGPTMLAAAAAGHLEAARGSIVNVSTVVARRPAPPRAAYYGASKAGLDALTRTWAIELGPAGIRVNAVAPGPTDTDALLRSGLDADVVRDIHRREASRTPLGPRRGRPEEIAVWILHLAAPDATWITGQVVDVDGGFALPTFDPE